MFKYLPPSCQVLCQHRSSDLTPASTVYVLLRHVAASMSPVLQLSLLHVWARMNETLAFSVCESDLQLASALGSPRNLRKAVRPPCFFLGNTAFNTSGLNKKLRLDWVKLFKWSLDLVEKPELWASL